MSSSQWPGLVTNASPFAIPATAAVDQVNLASDVPGQVYVRGGMRKVAVVGGSPDLLDCFPYERDGKTALISMLPDGRLVFQSSPSYGWQSRVPYEPNLSGGPLVSSSYTYRHIIGPTDDGTFRPPDLDPDTDVGECEAFLVGGTASSFAFAPRLDAAGCDGQVLETFFDGGSATAVADCSASIDGLCEGDGGEDGPTPRPPPPPPPLDPDDPPSPPLSLPSVPQNVEVVFVSQGATISWRAPQSDGGSPVVEYDLEVSIEGGGTPTPLPNTPDPPVVTAWGATSATLQLWPLNTELPSGWTLDLERESSADGITWTGA